MREWQHLHYRNGANPLWIDAVLAPDRCSLRTSSRHIIRQLKRRRSPVSRSSKREIKMAQNSKIGWTDHTHNFWWGCHKVSEECRFCYISGIMRRGGYEPFNGPMRTKNWNNPQRWQRQAERSGKRLRVFTCSMSDFFHPAADDWRDEAWDVIRRL